MAVLVPETTASSIPSFLSSYLLLGSTCATLYLLGCFIYNLYFHPLRRYPGPVLARCSRLWYTFYFVRGKFHLATQRAHEKYGDVVRVAPDELSYIATSAWKDIYGHRAGKPEMSKDPVFYANILSTGSLVTAPRERHGFIRRQLAHSFSASALREQESLVESYADLLIFKLSEACEKGSKPVNIVAWYNVCDSVAEVNMMLMSVQYYTFDVISDLAFGESFGCLKSNNYHPWVSTIVGGVKGSLLMKVGTHYPLLKTAINKLLVSKAMIEKKKYHRQMTVERLNKRLQQSTDRTDFLVKMVEPDSGVSHEEMLANASLLTVAGSETTATLLSALTYLLLKNPGERRKLREELESAFQSADQITCESTRHQPYLAACLEEGLRLFPPLPTSLPRKTPVGGDYINGAWVAEDVSTATSNLIRAER